MLQITPQHRLLLAIEPVDFRKGIDGLKAICRQKLCDNPFNGTVFAFSNRARTSVKLLVYDATGFWLCQKRFSKGHLAWWPSGTSGSVKIRSNDDERIILFVQLQENTRLDDTLKQQIRDTIRQHTSPRHVPAIIIQVMDIPRTLSGKTVELAVKQVVSGQRINNIESLANPQALELFRDIPELKNT